MQQINYVFFFPVFFSSFLGVPWVLEHCLGSYGMPFTLGIVIGCAFWGNTILLSLHFGVGNNFCTLFVDMLSNT